MTTRCLDGFDNASSFQWSHQSITRRFGELHFSTQLKPCPRLFGGPIRSRICEQTNKRPLAGGRGVHQCWQLLSQRLTVYDQRIFCHCLKQFQDLCLFLAESP
jgi:hypothetical protein